MKDVLDVYNAGESFNEEEQRMIISAGTGQAFFVGSTEPVSYTHLNRRERYFIDSGHRTGL